VRRAARVDNNQRAVIDALKKIGVSVEIIGKPLDLLICCRGVTSLMEVKNPEFSAQWSKEQLEFIERWPGKIYFVKTPEEAVREVLGKEVLA
jgi:hypothetical protein